jgi:DNA-binding transcriptional regulator YiaG
MTARQFRMHLKKAGVSQRRFALWLGFDVGTVNRWARGRQEVPRYATVLAELLRDHPELRRYPLAGTRAAR